MDRRRFVRDASYAAAGVLAASSSLGCAANVIIPDVPLLPLAPPVEGVTYIRASQIGCALDCNLTTGLNKHTGRAATDDGPRINAAMAQASASNPITLIIDGGALISGLFLPAGGYWAIEGLGDSTGFFVKAGTNNDGIHNGDANAANPSDPGFDYPGIAVPARGTNVSLSNFMLNGNGGNGVNGNSTTGSAQGSIDDWWYFGINLMNLDNITITNVSVVNSPSFQIRLSNVGNVVITGCTIHGTADNTDGLHFDGPANDISISNCNITAGDDAIALNCPEGYTGNISRVTVTNCTFNSWSLMRLYTMNAGNPALRYTIDTVTVTGCSGTFSVAAFLIGQGVGTLPNAVTGLDVSNCTLTAPAVLDLSGNFGNLSFSNVILTPYLGYADVGFAFARSSSRFPPVNYVGGSISITNLIYNRNGNFPVVALMLQNGATLGEIEFDGYLVQDPPGTAYAPTPQLLNIVQGTLGQVVIDGLTSTRIATLILAAGYPNIGAVSGAGVLGTGWQFPDAVMANGTPYISAGSGQESIKVGGVVKSYP